MRIQASNGQWLSGQLSQANGYFRFQATSAFAPFPLQVELRSVFDEVVRDVLPAPRTSAPQPVALKGLRGVQFNKTK